MQELDNSVGSREAGGGFHRPGRPPGLPFQGPPEDLLRRLLPFALLAAAPALLLAAPGVEVGGPTAEVQDLWAAATLDDVALAAAADGLTAWFEGEGQHLLDQPLDYSFVESVALDDLRAADVVGLADAGWDPLRAWGPDRDRLDERLARGRGVLATSAVRCSIDAVEARMAPEGELRLRPSVQDGRFANQRWAQRVVRGTRTAELDIDGAITRAVLELQVQVEPAELDPVELQQHWQLDLWLERDGASTLRLRSLWIEASSATFSADSRAWMGWALHAASESADDWTQHCDTQPAGPPVETAEKRGAVIPPRRAGGSRGDSTGPGDRSEEAASDRADPLAAALPDEPTADLPPLCDGVRLIEIQPWARRLIEIQHSSVSRLGSKEPEDVTVDEAAIDRWIDAGVRNWARVLGVPRHRIEPDDREQLRRLVERFGPETRFLNEASHTRLRRRWQLGLLREFLAQDPVVVPVCPAALDHTAGRLGYASAEKRELKGEVIDEIAAVALLEQGSVTGVGDEEWTAIREVLAFGDAVMNLFGRPDSRLDVVPHGGSKPDLDAVDSNL